MPQRHTRPNINPRQRLAVTLASYYACAKRSRVDLPLRRGLLSGGIPQRYVAEVFIHLSLVLGSPAMLDGLEKLRNLVPPKRPRIRSRPRMTRRAGLSALRRVYGTQWRKLLRNLALLHPELPQWIVAESYGRVISRPGLSLGDRELLNIVVLAYQGLERQLYSHLRGALRVGVPPGVIVAALKLSSRRTGKSVSASIQMFRAMTAG